MRQLVVYQYRIEVVLMFLKLFTSNLSIGSHPLPNLLSNAGWHLSKLHLFLRLLGHAEGWQASLYLELCQLGTDRLSISA